MNNMKFNDKLGERPTILDSHSDKVYSVPTTTSPNLFPVDGVVHRNIGSDFFVHENDSWIQ